MTENSLKSMHRVRLGGDIGANARPLENPEFIEIIAKQGDLSTVIFYRSPVFPREGVNDLYTPTPIR